MKIKYSTTINLDDEKFKNLDKKYIKEQITAVLDNIVSAIENSDYEIHFLIDENNSKN